MNAKVSVPGYKPLEFPKPAPTPTHTPHPVFAAAKKAAEERKRASGG